MADLPSENFEVLAELYETDSYAAFKVRRDGSILRLTRIARRFSEATAFRAAFRKDQPVLSNLHHDNILQFVDWGDSNGQLHYLTEFPEGPSLAARLDSGQLFSEEEVTDIGWQIASALQCAHNLGVAHGQLTLAAIQVSDALRIKVAGFGLYRWLAATKDRFAEKWSELARRDLAALGDILRSLTPTVSGASNGGEDSLLTSELTELIAEMSVTKNELTARDVQGRLGNMLLKVSGDSIEMVDHRKGQGLSRRSLVDELFDESEYDVTGAVAGLQNNSSAESTKTKRSRMQMALMVPGAIVLLAVVILFACSMMAARPANLGVTDGRLAPAPSSPNCVSTRADTKRHKISAFEFTGEPAEAMACLREIVSAQTGATIIEQTEDYLYAEFRSRIFRFVDDVEFHVDQAHSQIQFRSASRTGHSDLGVNRIRMERLRTEFAKCCRNVTTD